MLVVVMTDRSLVFRGGAPLSHVVCAEWESRARGGQQCRPIPGCGTKPVRPSLPTVCAVGCTFTSVSITSHENKPWMRSRRSRCPSKLAQFVSAKPGLYQEPVLARVGNR
jgi:hypothetical protein